MSKCDLWDLRKIFNKKTGEIMDKYGYNDIDEGELEAVTEKSSGIIYLFKPDGRAEAWGFIVDEERCDVKLFRFGDFDQ